MELVTRTEVATYNDLPITDNMLGDCRKTVDSGDWYLWISLNNDDTRDNWNRFLGESRGEGHITILPLSYDSIGQGSWAWYKESNYLLNGLFVNGSNADGDNINYKIYLDKGTYTLLYISNINNNYGITGIYIDEDHIVDFDCYSVSLAITVSNKQTGIVVTTSGIKTLKVKINGKNPASSDYYAAIEYIALWRTS